MKKKWKKIGIASGCIILFIILGILLLQSRFVKQKILSSLQLSLQKSQGIHVAVQSFDYNLLKLRFSFKGVQLQKLDRSSLPPVFRADEIDVNIPLSLLLRRRLRIQDIEIINPEVHIQIDQDGNNNFPFQTGPKKSPPTQTIIPDFLIEHFEAKNTKIHYIDKRNGLELGLSEIWIKGEGQDFGMHSFLMEMQSGGTVAFRGRSLFVERGVAQAQLEKGGLNISRLFLALANSELELSGRISDFSSLLFEGSMQGNFDVEDLRSLTAASNPFSGKIVFRSDLKGPLQEMEARISMRSKDLSYGKIENIDTNAELSWKNKALEILSFDLRKGKGSIHGLGTLHPLNWEDGSHLNLVWKDMDVETFVDLIQSPYPLSTETTGTLNVAWKGFSPDDVTGACDVRFVAKETGDHPEKGTPLSGRIIAKTDSGRLEITELDFSILDADLKGKLRLSSDELSGDLELEAQSIEKMMPLILAFAKNLDEEDVQRLGLAGPVSVSGTLGGTLDTPSFRFDLESPDFQVLKAKNLRLAGTVLYDLRTLQIQSLRIEEGEGHIEISGIYPVVPPGREMQLDIEGEALSLEKILKILGRELNATGLIQLKAKVEGRTDAPRVQSQWSVAGASLYGARFGRIEGEAHYRDGNIISSSIRIAESTGTLEASGFYDLRSNDFRVRLSGKSFPFEGLKIANNMDGIKGELDLDFEAYGNLENTHLSTKGRIRQLSIGARDLPDWEFTARSEQDEVLFKIEAPAFDGSIDGTVSLKKPHILRAELSVSQMRLEDLKDSVPPFNKYDFPGSVSADAHLSIDLGDPRKSLSFEARIEQAQLKSGDSLIRNDGPILLSFEGETIRVDRLLLIGTGTRIEAEGSLPLNIPSDSKILLSAEVDISLLNDFFPIKGSKGSLKMESKLLGSLSDLEVAAVLDFSDTRFQSPQIPFVVEDIQAHLEIDQNLLRIESFSGRIAEASFGLKGDIPLASLPFRLPAKFHAFEGKKANLVFTFSDWDPSSLVTLLPFQISQPFSGTISGRIELEGKSLRLEDMSGMGRLETFRLEVLGVSFEQDAPSHIVLERGRVSIENLSLRGGENLVNVSGTSNLVGGGDLNLSLDGELDLYLLNIFLEEGVFSGKSRFQINITRSYRNPEIQGFLDIQDGRYQRMTPRLRLEQVSGKINFKGDQVDIESMQGVLNGGKINLSGKIGLERWTLHDAKIVLKNENSFFDFPKGLHSQVSGNLQFLTDGKVHQVAGTITILDAIYRDDFKVGTAVYNLLRRGSVQDTLREPIQFLKNLNLNIDIGIANNFIIDNNIAKAEATAALKLSGTPYNPSLSGRASIAEGGEVYFNANTFSIEQGTVDFINPTRIEPELNLSAQTQVQEYEIRLVVQGTPDNLTASLVSDPPLSEPNIISLLVMGRTLESASAGVLSVAGSTALSYLNNAITGRIEQATARALGLESVRIDAGLVSTEENPEARITLGQHLSSDIELVFSQDLKDSRNQMWVLNYNPYKSFNIQGIKRDNDEFNLALRHEIQFGLKAVPPRIPSQQQEKKNLIIGDIRIEGQINLPESMIFQSLKLKKGRKIDFARVQDALERIRKLYQKKHYLSYSLAANREVSNGKMDMILQIDSGPQIFLEYEGASIPKRMKKEIVDTWVGSPFGQLALGDIEQRIRGHFMEKRYYEVKVRSEERKGEKGKRTLVFQIQKGTRYGKPDIRIEGNRAVSEKVIAAHLEKIGAVNSVFDKPTEWVKSIEDLYIRQGYLRPKVQRPVFHLERNEKKASVDVSIEEGDRYKVEDIELKGLRFFEENQILKEIGIRSGDIVSPERFNQIDSKIHELYVQKGFNDIRVQSGIEVNADHGTANLNIDVQENERGRITELLIEGNEYTSEKTIRRELMFHTGDVVNFRMINETRKRLYDLGIFERVNIDMIPIEQDDEKCFRVVIDVAELKPYRLRYGVQYDTDTSFGVLANLVNRNFLGSADLLGTSFRLNRDERDARAFFRSPYFFSKKLNTEFFLSYNRTIKPAFTLDRIGFTLQQQIKIKKSSVISYNYTYEKIDTLYPVFQDVQNMDTTDRLGTLNVAFSRDTRDDILDATRGMFLSQSLRYAPGFLGSKTQFIRYFGQYNTYQKLANFLTYAVSVRVGLGKGLSGDLPTSERFFAGGGTTIRGFKKDELGPRDPSSDLPLGGDGVFILNQELRFPIFKKLGGVVFLDLGNVYPKISDIDFFDIRKTAGFGFRLHTPFVLVRFDWGFKLDRRPGENLSQIFFSIGQAF